MDKLNGIVVDGKFYEAKACRDCDKCDIRDTYCSIDICSCFEGLIALDRIVFKFNQEITDKINNGGRQG